VSRKCLSAKGEHAVWVVLDDDHAVRRASRVHRPQRGEAGAGGGRVVEGWDGEERLRGRLREGSEKAPRRFEEVVQGCEARLGRPDAQPAPRPPGEMQARYRRDEGEIQRRGTAGIRPSFGRALAEMQPRYGRGTAEVRLRYGPGLRAHPSCSARYSLPCVNSSDGSGPVQQRAQRGGVDSFRSDGQRLEAEAAAAHLSAGVLLSLGCSASLQRVRPPAQAASCEVEKLKSSSHTRSVSPTPPSRGRDLAESPPSLTHGQQQLFARIEQRLPRALEACSRLEA